MNGLVNALTIDVEDYFQVSAFSSHIKRADWASQPSRVEANTDRLLALFADKGVLGTFFVLGWIAERFPDLVRRIARQGHEIASHGYSHELVYRQTAGEFRAETARSKHVLEDIIGAPVNGYRAASYSITRDSLWALDILAELGFLWDSSIFPIHHDRYGIVDAPRWPHTLVTPAGHTLTEFPLTTWQIAGVRLPVAGGGYFRLYPYALSRHALRHVNRVDGRSFIFYLHPWEIDPDQPRIAAGPGARFRHYVNLRHCETRLARLLDDFRFASVATTLAQIDGEPEMGRVAHA